MVQIIPAILATSEEQYQKDLAKLTATEGLKEGWLHIDFADNIFVPNQTVGVETVSKFPADFEKEAHLMVVHPLDWINKLVEANFGRIIFHIESQDDTQKVIEEIKKRGIEAGLAINNDTDVSKLEPFLDKIDMVLVMSVVAGFQGQPFIPESLNKVREIKAKGSVRVGIDGHADNENMKEIVEAGADFIIVGSYLLKGDTDENLETLWEEMNG